MEGRVFLSNDSESPSLREQVEKAGKRAYASRIAQYGWVDS